MKRQVERLGNDSQPAAILNERFERWSGRFAVRSSGVDGLKQVSFFGSGEEAQAGEAAGVSHGQPEYVGWLLLAVGVAGIAGQLDGAVQRDHGRARGRIGQKSCCKVEISNSGEVVRLVKRGATADFLGVNRVIFAAKGPDKLAAGELDRFGLVAEPSGPRQKSTHRHAIALDLDLGRNHVARIEAKGLDHVKAIGGIVKGHRAGSLKQPCGGGSAGDGDLVKGRVQLLCQLRLIGVKAERQSGVGGFWIDQIELLAAGIGVVLVLLTPQNPMRHLRALVGEDNLEIVVLNRCFRHGGSGDNRSDNRGSRRLLGGQLRRCCLARGRGRRRRLLRVLGLTLSLGGSGRGRLLGLGKILEGEKDNESQESDIHQAAHISAAAAAVAALPLKIGIANFCQWSTSYRLERNQSYCAPLSLMRVAAPCWSRRLDRCGFEIHRLWFRCRARRQAAAVSMVMVRCANGVKSAPEAPDQGPRGRRGCSAGVSRKRGEHRAGVRGWQ